MIVPMKSDGRITIPAKARAQLGITSETQFEIEVKDSGLVLRPALVLRREDAWAYTTKHRALLEAAHADSKAGRVKTLTPSGLEKLSKR
jgi:AbrB family looped-hinge helix DNA binding protein